MFVKYPRLATPTRSGLIEKASYTPTTFQTLGGGKIFEGEVRVTGKLIQGIDGEEFSINRLDNGIIEGGDTNKLYFPFYGYEGNWYIKPRTPFQLNLSPCVDLDNNRLGFGTSSPQAPHHFVQASNASTSVIFERHNGASWVALNNANAGQNMTSVTDLGGFTFSGTFSGSNNASMWVAGYFGQYAGDGTTRTGRLLATVRNNGAIVNPIYHHQDGRTVIGNAIVGTVTQSSVAVRGFAAFSNAFLVQNSSNLDAFGVVNSIRQAFFNANVRFNVRSVVGSISLLDTDFAVRVNAAGGASTAELADISSLQTGALQIVIKDDASANNITVNPRSGQTILTGSATLTSSGRSAGFLAINSTTWIRIF